MVRYFSILHYDIYWYANYKNSMGNSWLGHNEGSSSHIIYQVVYETPDTNTSKEKPKMWKVNKCCPRFEIHYFIDWLNEYHFWDINISIFKNSLTKLGQKSASATDKSLRNLWLRSLSMKMKTTHQGIWFEWSFRSAHQGKWLSRTGSHVGECASTFPSQYWGQQNFQPSSIRQTYTEH